MRGYKIDRNYSSCNLNPYCVGGQGHLLFKNSVLKTKVWIQILGFSELKTDARKGNFWNGCTQGFFCTPMYVTRKAIWTDARNGLWATGARKVWGNCGCAQPTSRMHATPLILCLSLPCSISPKYSHIRSHTRTKCTHTLSHARIILFDSQHKKS